MLTHSLRRNFICVFGLFFAIAFGLSAGETSTTFPLDQVHPGLKGVAYTIFTGEKAEHSGVVAGMSGSPVYFDGKLAGALSLKLGVFTKEAIGGVTPIQGM